LECADLSALSKEATMKNSLRDSEQICGRNGRIEMETHVIRPDGRVVMTFALIS
jgi:hypothetical protein